MKKVVKYVIIVVIVMILIVLGINFYVKSSTKNQIIKDGDYSNLNNIDCIIVLGAGIWGDQPSPMLEDRLLEGISLYENNVSSNDKEKLSVTETNTDRTIDKVSMTIKEGTLTKTGATVIIKDENETPYNYGAWYRIDKNENGEWKELDAFAEVCWIKTDYQVKEDGTLELEEIWKNIYGELEKGQYRLVKSVYEDGYKYFYAEFNID